MNTHNYSHLIFDKEGRFFLKTHWRKESVFSKFCWENWKSTSKRMKLEQYLSSGTKFSSKWIKDLNLKPDILKLLEENIGSALERVGIGKNFWNRT